MHPAAVTKQNNQEQGGTAAQTIQLVHLVSKKVCHLLITNGKDKGNATGDCTIRLGVWFEQQKGPVRKDGLIFYYR